MSLDGAAAWEAELSSIIEATSSSLKTSRASRVSASSILAAASAGSGAPRQPLSVAEVANTPGRRRGAGTASAGPHDLSSENRPRHAGAASASPAKAAAAVAGTNGGTTRGGGARGGAGAAAGGTPHALAADVDAVKSAVVQVAAEVGRHAQSTIETRNRVVRLGDEHAAHKETLNGMRQRLVEMESQRSQQTALVGELRRACEALRQQYAHLQSSINERATRGEVSASVQASVGPVRAQVEAALHHYSEGLATATATAAAAVHTANDAKRRAIAGSVLRSHSMSMDTSMVGDPELSRMSMMTDGGRGHGGTGGQLGNLSTHRDFSASMELIEARVERRMLRSVEDKIELEMSRARDQDLQGGVALTLQRGSGGGGGGRGNDTGMDAGALKSWQRELDGKMQECFQRVLEMGGKIAEEAQRRHLAVSAARAATRAEAKRIDELTAAAADDDGARAAAAAAGSQRGGGGSPEALETLVANLDERVEAAVKTQVDAAVGRLAEHFDRTTADLEARTSAATDAFMLRVNNKIAHLGGSAAAAAGPKVGPIVEELQQDVARLKNDLKAVRKLALAKASLVAPPSAAGAAPSSATAPSSAVVREVKLELKRDNAKNIQRAEERFDRQIKELRADVSAKHAVHDRTLAKIEEAVTRTMNSVALKGGATTGLHPPRKPKGPPPPNAKREPSSKANRGGAPPAPAATAAASIAAATALAAEASAAASAISKRGQAADVTKFQDDVRRTREMLNSLDSGSGGGVSSQSSVILSGSKFASTITSGPAAGTNKKDAATKDTGKPSLAPSTARSTTGTAATTKGAGAAGAAAPARLQCPFCLKRFEAAVLTKHKTNCDCRTVHCQYCGKGRMARQLKTHEQFCDQNPRNASKSEKRKCKHCDKYFSAPQVCRVAHTFCFVS